MVDNDQAIILTKLHRPRLSRDLIVRERLIELLSRNITSQITLICAPAGFGKTTLVSTWLNRMESGQNDKSLTLPSAWLSLDENDSDLNLFLRYFIAAVHTIFNNACEATLSLLQPQLQPPQSVIYTSLVNELEELPGEFILVLDDYHFIREEAVHNLFMEMARHWPKSLHLILISRLNPPLPIDNLRAKGMLTEIRSRNLRFTQDETLDYLRQLHIVLNSPDALTILEERFEGWPAGLHLVMLTMRSEITHAADLSELPTNKNNVTEYLVTEVLNRQLPAIHSFLLKTSILDRFCAPLCEAVLGEHDSAWSARACLDWIDRSELFIINLDDRREWFRYHNLFQDLLKQRLSIVMSPEQIANIHHQASVWFEEHKLLEEAVQHAIAAGDMHLVKHQMTIGLRDMINREDWPTLARWLRLLTEETIQSDPWLLMIRVWILELNWRLDLQAKVIAQVEELLNSDIDASIPVDDLKILRGQILMVRSQQLFFNNQTTQVIEMSREALALMPPSWRFVRGAAMLYQCLAMQANGKTCEAERLLLDEYESSIDKNDIFPLIVLQTLGYIYLWTGQLDKAIKIGQVLIQQATLSNITIMKCWGDYYLGVAHYQRNELEIAEQYFTQIIKNRYTANGSAYRDGVAGQALIHQIKGESASAWQLVEEISRSDIEETGAEDSRTGSLRARLQLLQGDLVGAFRWVETFSDLPPDQPIIWLEEPQVTRARILVARDSPADLTLAMQVLDTLAEITQRTHNTRFKIEILVVRVLALDAQGLTNEANSAMKQALDLAQQGGFIRVFIDGGQPMQALLQRLSDQGDSVHAIRPILAAFSMDYKNLNSSISRDRQVRLPSPGTSVLVDPLTPREHEILALLSEPLSIKKIALKLNISYETCRRHTANIYSKLGVNRRWDAVTRADELKIQSPR